MDAATACAVYAAAIIAYDEAEKTKKRTHEQWMRPWLQDRTDQMQCNTAYKLQKQLSECDVAEFGRMLRMPPCVFDEVLNRIYPRIARQDTNYRICITAEERLSLTLKYLATGESSVSLSQNYRVGRCTVGRIIKETCLAIYEEFAGEFLKTPSTQEEWAQVAAQFAQRWNYPGCLGAMDGKHVRICKPWNSGSTFFNYKSFFSVILFAVVNANYEFIYVDVGAEGKVADGGVWRQCALNEGIESGAITFPPPCKLRGYDEEVPYHFIADDAFPMGERILKPYSKRFLSDREAIFNYRLSRARRIVENAFGIISSKFRVLKTEISLQPESVSNVIFAICTLHNLLRARCGASYIPVGYVDRDCPEAEDIRPGEWRAETDNLTNLQAIQAKNATNNSKNNRDNLSFYFTTPEGEVHWQYSRIKNTYENMMENINN